MADVTKLDTRLTSWIENPAVTPELRVVRIARGLELWPDSANVDWLKGEQQ
jgi:hypothetical protein